MAISNDISFDDLRRLNPQVCIQLFSLYENRKRRFSYDKNSWILRVPTSCLACITVCCRMKTQLRPPPPRFRLLPAHLQEQQINVTSNLTQLQASLEPANKFHRWYVVQSGDSCSKIQDQFAIQFSQLQAWNPVSNHRLCPRLRPS